MTWVYLVGGDADGQFFEADLTSTSSRGGSGAQMVRGPGSWVYQASDRYVLARGRCQVYEAHGQWVPYAGSDGHEVDSSCARP